MNVELMPAAKIREAEGLLARRDGGSLREGCSVLLHCVGEDHGRAPLENGAPCLNALLKRLAEDPYVCLGLDRGCAGAAVKKAYRALALRHHPDKNANKTTALFSAVQQAYALLNDDQKRRAYDARWERRSAQNAKLRRRKDEEEAAKRAGSPSMGMRRPPSTNSFHMPPQSKEESRQRDFNKRFYNEYKSQMGGRGAPPQQQAPAAQSAGAGVGRPPPPPGGPPSDGVTSRADTATARAPFDGRGAQQQPPPPRPALLKMTSRTDTTVTLEWQPGQDPRCAASKAYELQWRLRGDAGKLTQWESASQLILHTTCRKRNLKRASCYEFRVRAASVSGWSPHSDAVMIVTLAEAPAGPGEPARAKPAPGRPRRSLPDRPSSNLPTVRGAGPKPGAGWTCAVCKRQNGPGAPKCGVCGTKKDYDPRAARDEPPRRHKRPSRQARARHAGSGTDDDDDDYGDGEVWAFTERDAPAARKAPAAHAEFDYGDGEPSGPMRQAPSKPTYWLNTAATCLHNVRREPIKGSPIVGHLLQDTEIEVLAETGNWIKCKYHRAYKPADGPAPPRPAGREGWCLKWDDASGTQYVVDDGHAYPKPPEAADEEEVIYELRDDDNRLYYFNSYTGVSMPEWTDTVDPASGAVYYTHSVTGETQWERPFDFVPIVREELYSTPQARFIKSILSPKRSHANMNHAAHHMPGVGLPRM